MFNVKSKASLITLSLLAIASTSGCHSIMNGGYSGNNNEAIIDYMPKMSALEIVAQESQKAVHAQKLLTKYQLSKDSVLDYQECDFNNKEIMVDYIGKPNELLSSIAIDCGYRYLEFGNPQYLPTVNFTQYWTTPFNALQNIDVQIGNAANLALDKEQKIIALFYPTHQQITESYNKSGSSDNSSNQLMANPNPSSLYNNESNTASNPYPYQKNWNK